MSTSAERRKEFLAPFASLREQVVKAKDSDVYALFPTLEAEGRPGWVIADGVPAVSLVAGAIRSLEIMRSEPRHRQRLWANTDRLMSGLRANGFDTLNSKTPVISVLVGEPLLTLMFSRALARAGVLVCLAIPPMVQPHMSRIRMHVTARHDSAAVDHTVRTIDDVAGQIGVPRTGGC